MSAGSPALTSTMADPIHTAICVSPTAPTPRIFPSIRCQGFIEEMMTSTTRLVFSSRVARMTDTE